MVFTKVVDSAADLCWLKMMKTELVTMLVSLRRRWCCHGGSRVKLLVEHFGCRSAVAMVVREGCKNGGR